jgi:hypothetical protein
MRTVQFYNSQSDRQKCRSFSNKNLIYRFNFPSSVYDVYNDVYTREVTNITCCAYYPTNYYIILCSVYSCSEIKSAIGRLIV